MARTRTRVQTVGRVLGRTVRIVHCLRSRLAENDLPDVFCWGDDRVALDFKWLPPKVERAIPNGYGTKRIGPEDWVPFVRAAILAGLL